MKNYKSLVLAAIVLAGSLFASCSKEGYWKESAEVGAGYSLPATTLSYTFAPGEEMTKVQIPIVRSNSQNDATLLIDATTTSSGYLGLPESVQFAAGQKQAFYEISILKDFSMGQTISATLKFDKVRASTAGVSSAAVSIKLDYNWESIGTGKFNDAWTWQADDFAEAEFFQAVENPDIFKIADPYTKMNKDKEVSTLAGYSASDFIQFQLLHPGDVIRGKSISKNGLVYFNPYMTGEYNSSYSAPIEANHPAEFSTMSGVPVTEANFVNNAVLSYQENGLPACVQFAPMFYMDGVGGYNYTTYSGVITIYFPDVPVYDYYVDVAYAGREFDVEDNEFIKADVSVGADVDSVQIAMSCLLSESDLLYAMLDGTVPSTMVAAKDINGTVLVPINNEGSGKYTLMAISYGGEDEESYDAQSYATAKFAYSAGGGQETWIPLYGGEYEYGWSTLANFLGNQEMNLYVSSTDGSKFRLYPFAAGQEVIFYNDLSGIIYIDDYYPIGLQISGASLFVGDAFLGGLSDFPGSFDAAEGVFEFSTFYHNGSAYYWAGFDYFTITGDPYEITESQIAEKADKWSQALKSMNLEPKQMPRRECKPVKKFEKNLKVSKVEVID